MQVHHLFPTPVVVIPFEVEDTLRNFLMNVEMYKTNIDVQSYGTRSKDVKILRSLECVKLREFILKSSLPFLKDVLGYDIKEMVDVLSWVSVKIPGQHHIPHTHPNSLISGIFYFDDIDKSTPVIFTKPKDAVSCFKIYPQIDKKHTSNEFSSTHYIIEAKKGNILLFPSYLEHAVPPNTTKKTRYSLSFNLMAKSATYGSVNDLTFIDFNDLI